MRIKTSELTEQRLMHVLSLPDLSWQTCGPIIEREGIHLYVDESKLEWVSSCWGHQSAYHGPPTPLIAAMRAFVASKLGEEVEIPEELL